MSEEKKVPAWMIGPGGAKPIRVQKLRFRTGITVDLPKSAAAKYVADDSLPQDGQPAPEVERTNIPRYKIYYLPWLGQYAVAYYPAASKEQFGRSAWIPREWAQADPAE